jgi:hemerythrin-like metal-binding protein
MLIKWKDNFRIDGAIIDADHQNLIYRINQINGAISSNEDIDFILVALKNLVRVTAAHFFREETLLKASNSQHSSEHGVEHKQLLSSLSERVTVIQEQLAHGDPRAQQETLRDCKSFLYRWILSHILVDDRKISAYVAEMGSVNEPIATLSIDDLLAYVTLNAMETAPGFDAGL